MQRKKTEVQYVTVSEDYAGQRVDNFLFSRLKGVPKAHVYRVLRKGEVRVNKKRIEPSYKLQAGDMIRVPPFFLGEQAKAVPPSKTTMHLLENRILYEDKNLLIINKPTGTAVHSGSTVRMGIIEILRHRYPEFPQLELAHRLDAETSGCLILAKKRSVLRELHTLLREGQITKIYWTLTKGVWAPTDLKVEAPLRKFFRSSGEHRVIAEPEGKAALTVFRPLQTFKGKEMSLLEVTLHTGRTHQIRVHAQVQGHPIAGDDRYGDREFNQKMRIYGLKRLFLHARTIEFTLPSTQQAIKVSAPLDTDLEAVLKELES